MKQYQIPFVAWYTTMSIWTAPNLTYQDGHT